MDLYLECSFFPFSVHPYHHLFVFFCFFVFFLSFLNAGGKVWHSHFGDTSHFLIFQRRDGTEFMNVVREE